MDSFFGVFTLWDVCILTITLYTLVYFIEVLLTTESLKLSTDLVVFLYLFGLLFFITVQSPTVLVWPYTNSPVSRYVGIETNFWGTFFIPCLDYVLNRDLNSLFILFVFFLSLSVYLIRITFYSIFLSLSRFFLFLKLYEKELILFVITMLFFLCCFMDWI